MTIEGRRPDELHDGVGSAKMSVWARCSCQSDGRLEENNDLPYWKLDAFEAMSGQQQSASIPPITSGCLPLGRCSAAARRLFISALGL
jgi:hypothetical protein